MKKLKVLFATSEIAPWVKTGGLGDVCGALPQALRQLGVDVHVLLPRYPALAQAFPAAEVIAELDQLGGALPPASLRQAKTSTGLPLLLLDCPALYDRPGNPYLDPEGLDWHDNAIRFGLLSRVAALLGSAANPLPWQAQLIHCHDWQTALAPAYLKYLGRARAATLLTVHNLAFQGLFAATTLAELGLPPQAWQIDGVEYHGSLSFLKGGLQHADWITSVSPGYAREIQTDAEGMGLAGLLRWRSDCLSGILNGIDDDLWNPASDPQLTANYAAGSIHGKAANKAALQHRLGLAEDAGMPLLGVISRLTEQKGVDLLPQIATELAALPAQLAVLGSGSHELEQAFLDVAADHPGQFAVNIGFDEGLAHQIEAGADMFLMPSRFEPCGLNQMYSLRYGTPPIVRSTGGLADSVVDCVPAALATATANGFVFHAATPAALLATVPAQQYAELYRRLVKG
ncbi:MAG: glycogen synthase GlgA [Proteobacteria bacterium]|nr:glycogen synthase GlgA [Pseudomonadota bacterium]